MPSKKHHKQDLSHLENGSKHVSLVKMWTFADGQTREKVVYIGTFRGAKRRILESRKSQFKIVFKRGI